MGVALFVAALLVGLVRDAVWFMLMLEWPRR